MRVLVFLTILIVVIISGCSFQKGITIEQFNAIFVGMSVSQFDQATGGLCYKDGQMENLWTAECPKDGGGTTRFQFEGDRLYGINGW
jgi:hypothetical protein